MKLTLKKDRWSLKGYQLSPISQWDIATMKRLVQFLTEANIPVPRVIDLRLQSASLVGSNGPQRGENEPLRAYRRRLRRWRKEKHGSISKMRRDKKAEQVKRQRWALMREQGLPLKDPEALIWFIRDEMWKPGNKLTEWGYLRHSVLVEVAGGVLPTGIDFDDVYREIKSGSNNKHNTREHMKQEMAAIRTHTPPQEKFRDEAKEALRVQYNDAKFKLRNTREEIELRVIKHDEMAAPSMSMKDFTKTRSYGRSRHYSSVTVLVKLDWYRKVYKRGLARAYGKRSLVLDVDRLATGEEIALVASQKSDHRYALTVKWMKFKQAGNKFTFEEE